ncbi:MAG: hypothetical protein KA285_00385 [Bacteroidia bacterium]|nr:hypothetical protein [Bacteroidia bacterium]
MAKNQKDNRDQQDSETSKRKIQDPSSKESDIPGNTELEDIEENEEDAIEEDEPIVDFNSNNSESKSFDQNRKKDSM